VLLAEGVDPATPIAMKHEGGAHVALRSPSIGTAAKWTVRETETEGPRPVRWKGVCRGDVRTPMRFSGSPLPDTGQRAKRLISRPRDSPFLRDDSQPDPPTCTR
jgi:hypothetical protein